MALHVPVRDAAPSDSLASLVREHGWVVATALLRGRAVCAW